MNAKNRIIKINMIEKFVEKISYEGRRKRELTIFQKGYKKYAALPEDEFTMEYIEAAAMYTHKKTMLAAVFITFLTSIVMGIWKFAYDILVKMLISGGSNNQTFIQPVELLSSLIIMLTAVAAVLLVFNLSRSIYALNKKKLLLEEIKAARDRKNR